MSERFKTLSYGHAPDLLAALNLPENENCAVIAITQSGSTLTAWLEHFPRVDEGEVGVGRPIGKEDFVLPAAPATTPPQPTQPASSCEASNPKKKAGRPAKAKPVVDPDLDGWV